jgi:MiaB-like tRNA modifying enzyme
MRVHIKTYGCTLNQADSETISSVLESGGIELVQRQADADVAIINTCTVKRQTAQRILDALKGLGKSNKRLLVTGCMAGANRDLIERYAPSASIVTPSNIPRIADAARSTLAGERVVLDSYSRLDRLAFFRPGRGPIAKVIISEGCSSSCSFCETRLARGPLNSFSEQGILDVIRCSAANGAKEIQLTSQDVGAYGTDTKTDIAALMRKISAIEGDFIVRVGMINPVHMRRHLDEFIDALRSDRFYKFAHMPVQSGSDSVLESMRRQYSVEEFEQYVKELRSAIPGITIETDMIVGFPAETESDFDRSIGLINRIRPDVTNISKFSARPDTPAAQMKQLTNELISERSLRMSRAVRAVQHGINDRLIGRSFDTLLTESTPRSFNGRNGAYKQIVIRKEDAHSEMALGSHCEVMITGASANVLYGTVP